MENHSILLLYLAGVVLIFLELYLPGGILGIAGGICLIFSIVIAFQKTSFAVYILTGEILSLIILIFAGLKIFPNTWVGRRLILSHRQSRGGGYSRTKGELETFYGKTGIALTNLRPSGTALIGDKRLTVVTEGNFIRKDTTVEVIEVEGNRIVVKRKKEEKEWDQ